MKSPSTPSISRRHSILATASINGSETSATTQA